MAHSPQDRKGLKKKKEFRPSSPFQFSVLYVTFLTCFRYWQYAVCSAEQCMLSQHLPVLARWLLCMNTDMASTSHSFTAVLGNMKKLPNFRKITRAQSFPAYMESSWKDTQVEGFPVSNLSNILVTTFFSIAEFWSLKWLLYEGSEFPPSTKITFSLSIKGQTATQNSTSPLPLKIWQR